MQSLVRSAWGLMFLLFVWTELRLRCMLVSCDGVWAKGSRDCGDWRRTGAKFGVPGRYRGESVSACEPGCYITWHAGRLEHYCETRSGAIWKERQAGMKIA